MANETFHHLHVLKQLQLPVADQHWWPKEAAEITCSNRCHEYNVAKVGNVCESGRCMRNTETSKRKVC